MGKKVVIPKNRDIEEFVEMMEKAEKEKSEMESKRQQFKKNIQVSDKTKNIFNAEKENAKGIEKKLKAYSERKDAQKAESERRKEYQRAMRKIEKADNEREIE